MAMMEIYPDIENPDRGKFYQSSEGKWFCVTSRVKDKPAWVRCCWHVLGRKKFRPEFKCPACKKTNLPPMDEKDLRSLFSRAV